MRVIYAIALALTTHLFRWEWLRFATSEIIRSVTWLGLGVSRLTPDVILVNGVPFQFTTSCTYIDVVLGAVPLLWIGTRSAARNLLTIAAVAGGIFVFNVMREGVSQILFAHGAPWVVADDFLGGISYLVIWLCLARLYRMQAAPCSS